MSSSHFVIVPQIPVKYFENLNNSKIKRNTSKNFSVIFNSVYQLTGRLIKILPVLQKDKLITKVYAANDFNEIKWNFLSLN